MTPKQKAKDLVDKFNFDLRPFSDLGQWNERNAIQCAIIAVDEILEYNKILLEVFRPEDDFRPQYWQQVKTELENL